MTATTALAVWLGLAIGQYGLWMAGIDTRPATGLLRTVCDIALACIVCWITTNYTFDIRRKP
jgi:hypothetical protein